MSVYLAKLAPVEEKNLMGDDQRGHVFTTSEQRRRGLFVLAARQQHRSFARPEEHQESARFPKVCSVDFHN
jgi:hypothetical protein